MDKRYRSGLEVSIADINTPHKFHGKKGFITSPQKIIRVEGVEHYFRVIDIPSGSRSLIFNFGSDKSQPPLTPALLTLRVIPILSALCEMEKIINGNSVTEPRIVAITQQSPVNVSMIGIPEAYKALREDIIPWRRRHQKEIAKLNEKEKKAEIERKKAEVAEATGRTEKEIAEAQKIRAESHRIEAETTKLRFELKKEQVEFAYSLVEKIAPDANHVERLTLFKELLPHVETLTLSDSGLSVPPKNED